jgi:mycothiol synthase
MPTRLPPQFQARPASMEDVDSVVQMLNLCSSESVGAELHNTESQKAGWTTPGFRLAADAVVVLGPRGELVGYADVLAFEKPHVQIRCWGRVHPEYRGLGIGTWLVEWEEERARSAIRMAPSDARVILRQGAFERDRHAHELLESHGFECVRRFWRMETDLDRPIAEPEWPEGIGIRIFDPKRDLEPAVSMARSAFQDHWGNVPRPLEQDIALWRHWIGESGFDARLWYLAVAGEEIVGLALCAGSSSEDPLLASVDSLAVARAWRRRGIGLALLRHAFRELQRRGNRRVDLGVDGDSLTGANRLYERAGMVPKRRSDIFVKELRGGRDLTCQRIDTDRASG